MNYERLIAISLISRIHSLLHDRTVQKLKDVEISSLLEHPESDALLCAAFRIAENIGSYVSKSVCKDVNFTYSIEENPPLESEIHENDPVTVTMFFVQGERKHKIVIDLILREARQDYSMNLICKISSEVIFNNSDECRTRKSVDNQS